MAQIYWVGGSGNWTDSENHWADSSGTAGTAGVPTNGDEVFLSCVDSDGWTITLDADVTVLGLNLNTSYDFTFAMGSYNVTVGNGGDMTSTSPGFYTESSVSLTSTGGTFTIEGGDGYASTFQVYSSFPRDVQVNCSGWEVRFGGDIGTHGITVSLFDGTFNFISDTTCGIFTCTETYGIIDLGSFSITARRFVLAQDVNIYSSSSNRVYLTENSGGDALLYTKTSQSLSVMGNWYIQGNAHFHPGVDAYFQNELHINSTIGTGEVQLFDGFEVDKFYVDSHPKTVKFEGGKTYTIDTSFNVSGTAGNLITLNNISGTTKHILSKSDGTITCDYLDISNSNATGGATWKAGANSNNTSNNSGWVFTETKTISAKARIKNINRYWVGGSGNWSDAANHWATSSGGSSGADVPTSEDDVFIDENSGFGAGGTITVDVEGVGHDLTCTSGDSYTIDNQYSLGFTGSITLESDITATGYGWTMAPDTVNETLTSAGVILPTLMIQALVATNKVTLQDNLELDNTIGFLVFYNGIFDANDHNIKAASYVCIGETGTYDSEIIMGSGTWEAMIADDEENGIFPWIMEDMDSGITITPETSTIKITDASSTQKTFLGGGKTYNNVWFTGAGTGAFRIYDGNTFNDLKVDNPPHTLLLPAEATVTVSSFTVSGSSGNLITIDSTDGATQNTLSKSAGTVNCNYLNISNSNAAGGASWRAYTSNGNTDGGNNSGWIFTGADNSIKANIVVTNLKDVSSKANILSSQAKNNNIKAFISAPGQFDNVVGADILKTSTKGVYVYVNISNNPPTVALDSPSDAQQVNDITPDLLFTGTDPNSNTIDYEVQISNDAYFADVLTYYFDASDGSILDPNSVWNNEPNAFDGSTSTDADTATAGSTSSNYLFGEGTNAPTSGGTISQVRARMYSYGRLGDAGMICTIYTNGLGESLGIVYGTTMNTVWSNYTVLSAPSGGWTWQKIKNLEVKIYHSTGTSSTLRVYRVEVEVTTSTLIDALSTDHTGFSAGASHPTASGAQQTYTVQSALSPGLYHWRVRGKDPTGGNTWGAWSDGAHSGYSDFYVVILDAQTENSAKAYISILTIAQDNSAVASIYTTNSYNQSTCANIKTINIYASSMKTNILSSLSVTQNVKINIVTTNTYDIFTKIDVLSSIAKGNSSKTSVTVVSSYPVSAVVNLLRVSERKDSSVKTFLIVTNIYANNSKADIYAQSAYGNTTKTSIYTTNSKNNSVIINVVGFIIQGNSSKASIVAVSSYNQSSIGDIFSTELYSNRATGNVLRSGESVANQTRSDILVAQIYAQSAKQSIVTTSQINESSLANILASISKNNSALASVIFFGQSAVSSKTNILRVNEIKSGQTKSSISVTNTKNNSTKAFIIVTCVDEQSVKTSIVVRATSGNFVIINLIAEFAYKHYGIGNILASVNSHSHSTSNIFVENNTANNSVVVNIVTSNVYGDNVKMCLSSVISKDNQTIVRVIAAGQMSNSLSANILNKNETKNDSAKASILSVSTGENSAKVSIVILNSLDVSVKTSICATLKNEFSIKSNLLVEQSSSVDSKADIVSILVSDNYSKTNIVVENVYECVSKTYIYAHVLVDNYTTVDILRRDELLLNYVKTNIVTKDIGFNNSSKVMVYSYIIYRARPFQTRTPSIHVDRGLIYGKLKVIKLL